MEEGDPKNRDKFTSEKTLSPIIIVKNLQERTPSAKKFIVELKTNNIPMPKSGNKES